MKTDPNSLLYVPGPRLNQLHLLELLSKNPRVTQAELGRRCDLSSAMINNYMKELRRLGLLEYEGESSRTFSYYLTPLGAAQLSAARVEWLVGTADLLADAKRRIRDLIQHKSPHPLRRVILVGTGEIAELVLRALENGGVDVVAVCDDDPGKIGREWCGRDILHPSQIRFIHPDAVIIVDLDRTEEIFRNLRHLAQRGLVVIRLDRDPVEEGSRCSERPESHQRPQMAGDAPLATIISEAEGS